MTQFESYNLENTCIALHCPNNETTPISTKRHLSYRAIRGIMLLSCYLAVVLFQTMSRPRWFFLKFNRTRDHEKSRFRTVSWVSCVNLPLLYIKSTNAIWHIMLHYINVTKNKRKCFVLKSLLVEYISNVYYILIFLLMFS